MPVPGAHCYSLPQRFKESNPTARHTGLHIIKDERRDANTAVLNPERLGVLEDNVFFFPAKVSCEGSPWLSIPRNSQFIVVSRVSVASMLAPG